jgi:integrase
LPYLPPKITGQLIPGRMDSAAKRLRDWLGEIGITDPDKVPMHSFRHRAAKRLRAAGVRQSTVLVGRCTCAGIIRIGSRNRLPL